MFGSNLLKMPIILRTKGDFILNQIKNNIVCLYGYDYCSCANKIV